MRADRQWKGSIACFFLAVALSFVACKKDDPCVKTTWFADTDSDGLGNPASTLEACEQPAGYVSNSDDTDDTKPYCDVLTWYEDLDGDGLGNPDVTLEECEQPDGFVSNSDDDNDVPPPANSRYFVGAAVDGEGYYTSTDDLLNGTISIIGNGAEGWANLSVSLNGYMYILNGDEGTLDKLKYTENGLVKEDAISTATLNPGSFYRYIQATDNGDLFLLNFPNENGEAPYAIIDVNSFSVESFGFFDVPDVNGKDALWVNAVVEGDKVYFGSVYGDIATWTQIADSLITVKYDYPSLTNPEILVSTASAGTTAGYRTNGTFKTENGDIYQYNLNSVHWYGHDELANKPTVFVRIKDGNYDDSYVLDVSDSFSEPITIWNAWYAGNDIVYANIVRESDIVEWGDLSANTGTLAEINLATKTVTELNIPKAPYVNLFSLNCVEDGKFYVPVSISGGEANIYEITIGGGADGFQKGAKLDGSNVYVNALYRNF